MADRYPANVKQGGTWATSVPNPHIALGNAVTSCRTLATAFSAGHIANAETVDVFIYKDDDNWAIYEGAAFGQVANILDLSAAALYTSQGTLSNTDTVVVEIDVGQTDLEGILSVADLEVAVPAGPTASGTIGQWAHNGVYYYECVATNTWLRFVGASSGWTN